MTLKEFLKQFIDEKEVKKYVEELIETNKISKEDEENVMKYIIENQISEIENEFFEQFQKDLNALIYAFEYFEPNKSYFEYNMLNSIGSELVKKGKIEEAKKVYELNTKFCLMMVDCSWIAIGEVWNKLKDKELASKLLNKALDMDCRNMESSWFLEYIDVVFHKMKDLELGKKLVKKYALFLVRSDGEFEDIIPVIKEIKKLYNEKDQKEIFYEIVDYIVGDMRSQDLCKVLNEIYDKNFECEFSDVDMLDKIIKKYNDEELYEYLKNEDYIN